MGRGSSQIAGAGTDLDSRGSESGVCAKNLRCGRGAFLLGEMRSPTSSQLFYSGVSGGCWMASPVFQADGGALDMAGDEASVTPLVRID